MKWKELLPAGSNIHWRHGHRAVAVNNSIIYYGGGNLGICNQAHLYKATENHNYVLPLIGKLSEGIASFGMAVYNNSIIIFGGMMERGNITNALITLDLKTTECKEIQEALGTTPTPRFGHSFTLTDINQIVVFGGISQKQLNHNTINYVNDLHILHIFENNKFGWEEIFDLGKGPCPRESHSAVFYHDKIENNRFIIIFGGMYQNSRLGDLWFFDLKKLEWTQYQTEGIPPSPRSLHSATLIGSKMFIFGGWIHRKTNRRNIDQRNPNTIFTTTNSMHYLDLEIMQWHEIAGDNFPRARSGHVATELNGRIYLHGGRYEYHSHNNMDTCVKDFWYFEAEAPKAVTQIQLQEATHNTLKIMWKEVKNADCYLVEMRKVHKVPININNLRLINTIATKKIEIGPKMSTFEPNLKKRKLLEVKNELEVNNKMEVDDEVSEVSKNSEQVVDNKDDEKKSNDESELKIAQLDGIDDFHDTTKIVCMRASDEKSWCTVGVYKSNSCNVTGYHSIVYSTTDLTSETVPIKHYGCRHPLLQDSMYAFRILALNIVGKSDWSKFVAFKTKESGVPTAPSNCKFILGLDRLRLAWNPNAAAESVTSYAVDIAFTVVDPIRKVSFVRIYEGTQPQCSVSFGFLKTCHVDENNQLTFRCCAKNKNGVGPILQSRLSFNLIPSS